MALRWRSNPDRSIRHRHEERCNRVRSVEPGDEDHDASDERSDEGIQVGQDVLKAALDVQAVTIGLRHDPCRGEVHDHAGSRHNRHRQPGDVGWCDQA